jgi:peptidoglycan/LPS O-acetylase OafA/YrhL
MGMTGSVLKTRGWRREMPDVAFQRTPETYRSDIDGLRAVAITSVVLYHAGVPFLTGGFTGVDVFFVISGYLIGGHIFAELRAGEFSFLSFYRRRAKRILPAFYLVMSFTLVAAMLLLSPAEAGRYAKGAISAALSVSNIYFLKSAGYFQSATEMNPLLMT